MMCSLMILWVSLSELPAAECGNRNPADRAGFFFDEWRSP